MKTLNKGTEHFAKWDGKCVYPGCGTVLGIRNLRFVCDESEEWHCPECEAVFNIYPIFGNLLVEKHFN